MTAAALRIPALVACATGAGVAVVLATVLAGPGELAERIAIALVVMAYTVTATVILVGRPGNRVGGLMMVGAVAWAVGELLLAWGVQGWARSAPVVPGASYAAVAGTAVRGVGWLVLVLGVPLVFPNGATAWPGRRGPRVLVGLSMSLWVLGCVLAPYPLEARVEHLTSPTGLPLALKDVADGIAIAALLLSFATLVVAVIGLRVKWRRADALERQQLLWFTAAFALPLLCLPLAATPWASPWLFAAVSAPTPIAVAVALRQRRLYDIHLAMSRSLTYVMVLWAAVAIYAATIAVVGVVLRRPGAEWLPWVAAAVVALVFSPLRHALQSVANRLTYGHWSAPADVLAATERRLRDATDLPGLLQAMVVEVAELLRLPRLEVLDRDGELVCVAGEATTGPTEEQVLSAYGSPVGTLRWATTSLGAGDRRVLRAGGEQLGEALHAIALVAALRRAQERLVVTREEERKRLRRDLHDGLGPSLAALGMEVDSLRNRLPMLRAEQADAELVQLRSGIHRTVVEVRRVVDGLRPPALDELGLDEAIQQLVHRLTGPELRSATQADPLSVMVSVGVDGQVELPAATEVAAFRITQEALTNAIRHSDARHVSVSIGVSGADLAVRVTDDGHGMVEPRDGGVGLSAMRERAEELGGSVAIRSEPTLGTTVEARLPLHPTGIVRMREGVLS